MIHYCNTQTTLCKVLVEKIPSLSLIIGLRGTLVANSIHFRAALLTAATWEAK
jgi:hypothetical protein